MMRSLWAGVTGLGAHQIAMDVEGNNISNVNTTGFKYSRVNFANLLSQTSKIATAPQGELGGKNPMQVGLGTQVTSITTIYKQGSVQTTDKNTDLAIQGDGFFVVSPDGGQTYKYTRNGDFNFDAVGNFTDSNGYIIQGWMRDRETGEIDSTAPIRNITIPPGLTTPANDTTYITLKANLNSGNTIVNKKTIYELDAYNRWYDKNEDKSRGATETHNENSTAEDMFNTDKELTDRALDMGVLFNSTGEALNLRQGQGAWISYARAETSFDLSGSLSGSAKKLDIELNGVNITADIPDATDESMVNDIAIAINAESSKTGVTANVSGTTITLSNDNNSGTDARTKNIDLNEDLSWHFVEKIINDEISWLKKNISVLPRGYKNYLSPPFLDCDNCILRKIAILIVNDTVKAIEFKLKGNESMWSLNSSEKRTHLKQKSYHGKEWHRRMMDAIHQYFKEQNYKVVLEPSLNYGRADLGVYVDRKQILYIEVGTISLYKLWFNLSTMRDVTFLIVPSEETIIELKV